MMDLRRVILLPGANYQHRNGDVYHCIERRSDSDFVMQSPKGWTCTAHNVWQQEDGLIFWDYSTGGHFEKVSHRKMHGGNS